MIFLLIAELSKLVLEFNIYCVLEKMGRGVEKCKWCVRCGKPLRAKRLGTKTYKLEMREHEASGECKRRQEEAVARQEEVKKVTGAAKVGLDEALVPIYELLRKQRQEHEELKARVEKRLESRKSHREYKERDAKPKPWKMRDCIKDLQEADADVVQSFRDIMTKGGPHDFRGPGGWSWQR